MANTKFAKISAWLLVALMIISSIAVVKADVWQDDMEGDVSGYTYDGMWHLVNNSSNYPEWHSFEHAWWYGNESTGNYDDGNQNWGNLTTPQIDTTGITEAYLDFWSWYETENSGTTWDRRWVQISTDNNTWNDLGQLSGDNMNEWVNWMFNISAYVGGSVWIRFFFDTMDGFENNYRGWYIDDVAIKNGTIPKGNADVYIHNIVVYNLSADLDIDGNYQNTYNVPAGETIFAGTWELNEGNHNFEGYGNDSTYDQEIAYVSNSNTTEVHLYLGQVVDLYEDDHENNVYVNNSTEYIVHVKNNGNFTANITLEITWNSLGWNAELNRTNVVLNAGEETTVKLTVQVPENAEHRDVCIIEIRGWTEYNNTTYEDWEYKYTTAMKHSNGPDDCGYWWKETNYNWIEISGNGTQLNLTNGNEDDGYGNITLPYGFPYHGDTYTTVYVGTNGLIGFSETDMDSYSNTVLPDTSTPNNIIAVLWDDLEITGGAIYYKHFTGSNYTVIEYYNVYFLGATDNITFEVIIYDNGNIKMQYEDVYGNDTRDFGAEATIGIENETGECGLTYGYNNDFLANGSALLFYPPGAKFEQGSESDSPEGGPPYEQLKFTITVNVSKAGNYKLYAELWSEDNARFITSNETIVYLDVGEHTIDVYFEGNDIEASGEDGQYNVHWELYQEGSWEKIDNGQFQTTTAYKNEEFVPEFSLMSIPLLATIGIFFLLRRRKF